MAHTTDEATHDKGDTVTIPNEIRSAMQQIGVKKVTQKKYLKLLEIAGTSDPQKLIEYLNTNKDSILDQLK